MWLIFNQYGKVPPLYSSILLFPMMEIGTVLAVLALFIIPVALAGALGLIALLLQWLVSKCNVVYYIFLPELFR